VNENKHDEGKPPVGLMLSDFPRALLAVAEIAGYGCRKYGSPSGWQNVDNGVRRYDDALGRHLLAQSISDTDEESGLLHAAHLAWNALAVLELRLKTKHISRKELYPINCHDSRGLGVEEEEGDQ